ncbi:CHAP domain-containing protein [Shouchella sp. 1P09AA]|uniref:CHAP domain-containing protein n=1 Tax=unclassified Shouchella TaxID=2893065 RepID=UPI0039A152BC
MSSVQTVLTMEQSQIGLEELPINQIKYNDWYYGSIKNGDEYPWCATFISWIMHQAGVLSAIYGKHAACRHLFSTLAENGRTVQFPQPGDLVFFCWTGNEQLTHMGIVEDVSMLAIQTIEGNFFDRVQRMERPFFSYEYTLFFARPAYKRTDTRL